MSLEDVLESLQEVDGYLAATIFDINKKVLVKHNNSKEIDHNAEIIINTIKAVNEMGVGTCHFIQIDSESGIFGATWLVENESIAIVLLEPKSNVGLAKMILSKIGKVAKKQKLASFFIKS